MDDDEDDRPPHGAIGARRVVPEPRGQGEDQRHRDQRHNAQARVEVDEDRCDRNHGDDGGDRRGQARRQQLVEGFDVGGEPGDDPAGGVALEEGKRKLLDVREQQPSQVE